MAPHELIEFGSRDWWLTVPPAVAVGVVLLFLPRLSPWFKGKAFLRLLAALLTVNFLASIVVPAFSGRYSFVDYLPLHLCSITALMAPVALLFPAQRLGELLYFWGVAGGLQSVLTPEFTTGRDGYMEAQYFMAHLSIIWVPVFMIWHQRFRPAPRSWLAAFLWIQGLVVVVGAVNFIIGSNFMFLCRAPAVDNPLVVGPWPWYILGFEVVAFVHFYLLGWPFRRRPAELVVGAMSVTSLPPG